MRPAPSVASFELKQEILQLYEDYAEVLDNLDIDTWPEFFVEDCLYVVTSRENHDAGLPHGPIYCEGLGMVKDRAAATRDCTVYEPRSLRHFIHGLRVTADDGQAIRCHANFMVVESVSDMQPYVHTVGRYLDTLMRTPQGLRIKERLCVYDNYSIFNSLVFPI